MALDMLLGTIRDDITELLCRCAALMIEVAHWSADIYPGRLHGEDLLIDIYVSEWVQALEHAGIDIHQRPGYAREELCRDERGNISRSY